MLGTAKQRSPLEKPKTKADNTNPPEGRHREAAWNSAIHPTIMSASPFRPATIKTERGLAMKLSSKWVDRAKFVVGVLAVWAAVGFVRIVWDAYHREPGTKLRLQDRQLCRVFDAFTEKPGFSPSWAIVKTAAYEGNPDYSGTKYEKVTIDQHTLVMVKMDMEDPDFKELGPNKVSFDTRMVLVQFITGPYSGRTGQISRNKIDPFSFRD
jgi:hypothetical protein